MKRNKNPLFIEYNNNPLGKRVSDCTIRAISKALGISWEHCFEDLIRIARELKVIPNESECYGEYLKTYQTIKVKYETPQGNKRYTPKDICSWDGAYVITLANHLTCVVDGKVYDTWDCSNKSCYKIWRIR